MTNDETQRKMDFIVNQQAQFSVDIQQLKERHAEAERRLAKTDGIMTRIAATTLKLAQRMLELTEAQANSENKIGKLAEAQERLAKSQEHSDQRLSALIDIVRNSKNGQG
jgi:regulator of sigma D